jgi:hypothetical protein
MTVGDDDGRELDDELDFDEFVEEKMAKVRTSCF